MSRVQGKVIVLDSIGHESMRRHRSRINSFILALHVNISKWCFMHRKHKGNIRDALSIVLMSYSYL